LIQSLSSAHCVRQPAPSKGVDHQVAETGRRLRGDAGEDFLACVSPRARALIGKRSTAGGLSVSPPVAIGQAPLRAAIFYAKPVNCKLSTRNRSRAASS